MVEEGDFQYKVWIIYLLSLKAGAFHSSNPATWVIGRVEFLIKLKHSSVNTALSLKCAALSPITSREQKKNNCKCVSIVQREGAGIYVRERIWRQARWLQTNHAGGLLSSAPRTTGEVCVCPRLTDPSLQGQGEVPTCKASPWSDWREGTRRLPKPWSLPVRKSCR